MIKASHNKDGTFTVNMDAVDHIVLSRLADTYGLRKADMLVGCINKGIDAIGSGIAKKADPRWSSSPADDSDYGGD